IVMGDMTLTEPQVNPAMSAALDNGLQVTALHNHFFFDRPHVFFMHIGGVGTTEQLATGVRKALDAANAAQRGTGFGGVSIPAKSTIDSKPLETILGASAQAKDGIAKFSFGRKTSMHGTEVGEAMGVNTWAAFAGSQRAAVVDGDFAMLEDELQDVLKALRHANIDIVAIHNHMTHEQPRITFLHFWAKGPAEELARGVKSALNTQKKRPRETSSERHEANRRDERAGLFAPPAARRSSDQFRRCGDRLETRCRRRGRQVA